jgi:hypothetical protein
VLEWGKCSDLPRDRSRARARARSRLPTRKCAAQLWKHDRGDDLDIANLYSCVRALSVVRALDRDREVSFGSTDG